MSYGTITRLARLSILLAGMSATGALAQPAVDRLEESIADKQPGAAEQPAGEPGYLGVIADDRADAGRGVRIQDVVAGAPGDRAGLKVGDLITALDGQPVRNMNELAATLGKARPDQRLNFTIDRAGKSRDVPVTLTRRPPPGQRPYEFGPLSTPPANRRRLLGVRTLPVTEEARQVLRLPSTAGALVSEIVPGSPAAQARIPVNAIIVEFNGQLVRDPNDLARQVEAVGPGKDIEVGYYSQGALAKSTVRLGEVAATRAVTPAASPAASPPLPLPGPETENDELREQVRRLEERLDRLERLLEEMSRQGGAPLDRPSHSPPPTES